MSAAFDTIDRQILLDIIERIVEQDELRIIRFLLIDTGINTRINGATKERPCSIEQPLATPQGDSFQPRIVFSIFRECPERSNNHLATTDHKLEKTLPTEIAYADDVDFVGLNFVDRKNTNHRT